MGNSFDQCLRPQTALVSVTASQQHDQNELDHQQSNRPQKDTFVRSRSQQHDQQQLEHHQRAAVKQQDKELKSLNHRLTEMEASYEDKLKEERSALIHKNEEVKSVTQRFTEMETFYKGKLNEDRSALKQKDEELKSVKQRFSDMETFYKEKLGRETAAVKQQDKELKSLNHRLTEMEASYEDKLKEKRAALSKKDEELKSFKDRVAAEVALSIKAGDTERINSPVSKTRLIEMYNQFKLLQWPKIKDLLKSKKVTPEFTKALIQKQFKDASEEVDRKKKQIEEVFSLIEFESGLTSQKIKQYFQTANQNLQLCLYNSSKEDLLKTPLLEHEAQYSQDVSVKLRLLASECYWLGCLMLFNNPPLQPDWQNHVPGMDPWDIFPREIKSF